MIALVCTVARERAAFAALCEARGLAALECDSVRSFVRTARQTPPRVVLVRHKLADGYSDDVIAALRAGDLLAGTRVIVLVGADTPSSVEARQIALGADCVQRDPVRTDVLAEYLVQYDRSARGGRVALAARPHDCSFEFAGANVAPLDRVLRHRDCAVALTPRETQLAELLAQSNGGILSYDTLYSEILHRRFRGDTSNMRVLLGKLCTSAKSAGISLRQWIQVIPKTGYRFRDPREVAPMAGRPQTSIRPAA